MNNSVASYIFSKNTINRIDKKINLLGIKLDSYTFCSLRLISSVLLFIIFILFKYGFILSPLITLIYYYLFEFILLDLLISYRVKKIESDAIEFFPIFLISLNSTNNIKKAIKLTISMQDNILSKEFIKVDNDIKAGKSLIDSLMLLKARIPSQIVNNIITSIIESSITGNSINNSVNKEIDYLSKLYNRKVKERYKRIPLKLLISCIFFTICMFLLSVIFIHFS